MITGKAIADEARRWCGVPYLHQGRSHFGVDCIGFVIAVRSAIEPWPAGMDEVRNYARRPKDGLLADRVAKHCTRLAKPELGCMILIKWPNAKEPAHTAIYADGEFEGGNIIHAYGIAKKVIETGYRGVWVRNTHSWWRLPGVMP